MTGYRRMGRERKRYLRALRLAYEPRLRIERAAFRAARRRDRGALTFDALVAEYSATLDHIVLKASS